MTKFEHDEYWDFGRLNSRALPLMMDILSQFCHTQDHRTRAYMHVGTTLTQCVSAGGMVKLSGTPVMVPELEGGGVDWLMALLFAGVGFFGFAGQVWV